MPDWVVALWSLSSDVTVKLVTPQLLYYYVCFKWFYKLMNRYLDQATEAGLNKATVFVRMHVGKLRVCRSVPTANNDSLACIVNLKKFLPSKRQSYIWI